MLNRKIIMNIELRDFTEYDIKTYEKLHEEIDSSQYMSRIYPQNFNSDLKGYIFKAITIENNLIGAVWLEKEDIKINSYRLGIMIGKKEYLGKGIGRIAIKKCINVLKQLKEVEAIYLNVKGDNFRAIKCYESIGFKTFKTYYKIHKGINIKCYSMKYELKNDLTCRFS